MSSTTHAMSSLERCCPRISLDSGSSQVERPASYGKFYHLNISMHLPFFLWETIPEVILWNTIRPD